MSQLTQKVAKKLSSLLQYIGASLLLFMSSVVLTGVVARYIIKRPLFWAEELSRYLMIYMVLLGSSIALYEGKHPKLTFVLERLPFWFRRYWSFFLNGFIIFVLILIFWEGYLMTVDALIAKTPALRISFSWIYLSFPIGAVFMVFYVLTGFFRNSRNAKNENARGEEPE